MRTTTINSTTELHHKKFTFNLNESYEIHYKNSYTFFTLFIEEGGARPVVEIVFSEDTGRAEPENLDYNTFNDIGYEICGTMTMAQLIGRLQSSHYTRAFEEMESRMSSCETDDGFEYEDL